MTSTSCITHHHFLWIHSDFLFTSLCICHVDNPLCIQNLAQSTNPLGFILLPSSHLTCSYIRLVLYQGSWVHDPVGIHSACVRLSCCSLCVHVSSYMVQEFTCYQYRQVLHLYGSVQSVAPHHLIVSVQRSKREHVK